MSKIVKTHLEDSGRRRGRPPSPQARASILSAAREMLEEGGLLAITVEGVATRARVGKPTIYRHWSNRYELAMAALLADSSEPRRPACHGSPVEALRQQLRGLATLFASGTGRHVTALLSSGYGETELSKAFRTHFVQTRRDEGRALMLAAIAASELRADLNVELALDLVYGPIFYRLTMGHGPVDTPFVDGLLSELVEGLAPARA
jgi:AcrR family transcriptional regulator